MLISEYNHSPVYQHLHLHIYRQQSDSNTMVVMRDIDNIFATPFVRFYYTPTDDEEMMDAASPKQKCTTPCGKQANCKSKKSCRIPIDVRESETCYEIMADLPGYPKEMIHLDFDEGDRTLHIIAKPTPASPSQEFTATTTTTADSDTASIKSNASQSKAAERWIVRERPDRTVTECERKVDLPKDAVAEQATAAFVDGVLTVRIPRQLPKKHTIALH